jgi:hypothetical protein
MDRSFDMIPFQFFVQLLPVSDAGCVQTKKLLESSVLRFSLPLFEIHDGVVMNTRHLHHSPLRQTRLLPQSLHPLPIPLVGHLS